MGNKPSSSEYDEGESWRKYMFRQSSESPATAVESEFPEYEC